MSDDEDDYLSDKFLVDAAASSPPKTYTERRKEAQRIAALRDAENRKRSQRELEQEAREEGLSKSLFARAKEEEDAGHGQKNKALAMMMKMGFQPGQSLGNTTGPEPERAGSSTPAAASDHATPEAASPKEASEPPDARPAHRVAPLPLNEWRGARNLCAYSQHLLTSWA